MSKCHLYLYSAVHWKKKKTLLLAKIPAGVFGNFPISMSVIPGLSDKTFC